MIPSEIALLDELEDLYFEKNDLSTCIPSEIGLLQHLANIYLYKNNLKGTIPSEIALRAQAFILTEK